MINSKKKGFTIVELVIVIAVVAILAAVLIPTFSNLVKKANESSDIQAVRNMNVYLAQANATDDVKSILDVYDIFDESDYEVENYKPLYKGRFFYYDTQKKQMLYVDENNKIIFPAEFKGQQVSDDIMSLSMEIKSKPVTPSNGVYTVANAEEYAYVVEQLNSNGAWATNTVEIKISGAVNFKGGNITILEVPTGKELKITGTNNAVMKNITTTEFTYVATDQNATKDYGVSALVGTVAPGATFTIENVTLENINVKNTHAGTAGILAGYIGGKVNFNGVTIKDSHIIGNRDVAAIAGYVKNIDGFNATFGDTKINLINVKVETVAGRAAKLFAKVDYDNGNIDEIKPLIDSKKITAENVTLSIYECEQNTGKCLGCNAADCDIDLSDGKIHSWHNDSNGDPYHRVAVHFEDANYLLFKNARIFGLSEDTWYPM